MRVQIKLMGYYWPTMINDCENFSRQCHMCQIHGDFIHQHPNALHPTVVSWPFEIWGTDIIGPIDPPASNGHRFILAATDYFSKWAEARSYREIKASDVVKFFTTQVLYRYGNPRKIISDNGTAFKNAKIDAFADKHKIEWRYSSVYNPRANGLAEAFNKTLIKILRKTIGDNQRNWHEKLHEALWAYRITHKTATQATPYSLVYGAEAVLPIEVELPSLRVAMAAQIPLTKQTQLRLQELDGMDEKRLAAQQNLELYQARMTRAYEKLSRPRTFKKGELVLVLRRPILGRHHGPKFAPNWEGPYVIEQAYEGGAYLLADSNGKHPVSSINGRYLKKYYGQNYPDVPAAHRSQRKSNQQTDWADNCEAVNHLFA
ncbi:RNA-directed DNA polymerase [Rhynchospora pubera]|uniref:RNA-directed DNA polymerase n=2 Tax=Rhynchospora pubera TaxID=906938 RepID=A0AAV8C439_9POAL|nr:RNA-directed DNA polymerase [Rhynchospora pubera]